MRIRVDSRFKGGITDFRFRYVLRCYTGSYRNAETVAWSRSVTTPLASMLGHVAHGRMTLPAIQIDRSRAVVTCLKPADGSSYSGVIVRLWETAGRSDPVRIDLTGYSKAIETELLERDRKEMSIADGHTEAKVNANGLCGIRLLP